VTYGVSVYYLLPLALVSMNLGLLLQVFFIILMSMFQGLVMIAHNTQRLVQSLLRAVLFLLLLPLEPGSTSALVRANMKAHSLRNSRTSFIFASAVGFTIFLLA